MNPKCLSTSNKGPMEYSYTLLNISKKWVMWTKTVGDSDKSGW